MNLAVINHSIGAEDPQPKTPDQLNVCDQLRRIRQRLKLELGAVNQGEKELTTRFVEALTQVITLETKLDILLDGARRLENRRVVKHVPNIGAVL
jgi:hypothetical protein